MAAHTRRDWLVTKLCLTCRTVSTRPFCSDVCRRIAIDKAHETVQIAKIRDDESNARQVDQQRKLIDWLADVVVNHNLGASAKAILHAALTERQPATHPADMGDYNRCLALIAACPVQQVQERMKALLVDPSTRLQRNERWGRPS